VSLAPDPREGAIRVSARDAGGNAVAARVLLDGAAVGTTPCTIKALVGRHALTARLDGARWDDSVLVAERQVVAVQARMRAADPAPAGSGAGAGNGPLARGQAMLRKAADYAGGSAAWAAIWSISVNRDEVITVDGQSMAVTSAMRWRIPAHYAITRKLPIGEYAQGFDGTSGWTARAGQVLDEPKVGEQLKKQYERSILRLFAEPGEFLVEALDESRTMDGVNCSVARVKNETTPDWVLCFAPNGALARMEYRGEARNGVPAMTTEIYGDWQPVGAQNPVRNLKGWMIRYPRSEKTLMDGQPVMDARVTSVKLNPTLADDLFRKPAK
jgi:hypothetical protein